MRVGRLFVQYIWWHYTRGFIDLFHFLLNILWSVYNIFSIPFLLLSLFAPFERMHENVSEATDGEDIFASIVANIILRIVGAVLRLTISVIGTCLLLITLAFGLVVFVVWPFIPVAIVGTFVWGIYILL